MVSFATMPVAGVVAGALLLVAILYGLQRLRARRRVLLLPTAGLWRQAMQDAPLTVLGSRFRYWLAFLLAVAIALLLWLAVAGPMRAAQASAGTDLFYFDASAPLTAPGADAAARRALIAAVRATSAARRAVFLGDAVGTRLLAPGESASLLAARLDRVTPEARPSTFGRWLTQTAAQLPPGQTATVHYYGGRAAAGAARVPNGIGLRYGYLAPPVANNRGIVALGAMPAASGRWRDADVLVAVAGRTSPPLDPAALTWTLDGEAFVPDRVAQGGRGSIVLRDVPATGGVLRVALRRGDGFPADDSASLRLPDRRPVLVALLPGVPATIRRAVAADDAFATVDAGTAQVIVRTAGSGGAVRPDLPTLILSDPARTAATFVFAGPGERVGGALATRLDDLGITAIEAGRIADMLHRPIAADVADAPRRSVAIWRDLFDPRAPFAGSPAMPLLVTRSLRWLAGERGWTAYAKAAASPGDVSATVTLGDPAPPPAITSLTDRRVTADAAVVTPSAVVEPVGRFPGERVLSALLLAALALLAAEWWLVQRRWMA